jgi:hypothetical protein
MRDLGADFTLRGRLAYSSRTYCKTFLSRLEQHASSGRHLPANRVGFSNVRFVIVNHSPKMFAKTDLCWHAREKAQENVFSLWSTGFLWSGFRENYRKIRAISLD